MRVRPRVNRRVRSFILSDEHSRVQYIQILRRKNKWRVLTTIRRYKPYF